MSRRKTNAEQLGISPDFDWSEIGHPEWNAPVGGRKITRELVSGGRMLIAAAVFGALGIIGVTLALLALVRALA